MLHLDSANGTLCDYWFSLDQFARIGISEETLLLRRAGPNGNESSSLTTRQKQIEDCIWQDYDPYDHYNTDPTLFD
jgi:hypothetical protein